MPPNLDGTGYYRCLFPARELAARGHPGMLAPHARVRGSNDRVMFRYEHLRQTEPFVWEVTPVHEWLFRQPFDVLLMGQRTEGHWAPVIEGLRSQGKRVVVDCDDDWLEVPAYNPGSKKPREHVEAMLAQLRAADALSVSTPALAEVYGEFNDNIQVVRNTLDWRMWADVPPVYESRTWRKVRVGWMGQLRWRRGDLDVLRGVIGPWLERNPDVEFVAAGDPTVHDYLGIPKAQRVSVQGTMFWRHDLADITAVMDVGLVPLALNRLNEGKSHLKGLEYAAAGIPCVASPSESYRWWVEPGVNGFLAGKPQEWFSALDGLVNDRLLRVSMGRAARAKAAEHTIQSAAGEWEGLLNDVCGFDRDAARARVAA